MEDSRYFFNIPATHYPTIISLITALNDNIPTKIKPFLRFANKYGTLQIISTSAEPIVMSFPIEFEKNLGFDSKRKYINTNISDDNNFFEIIILKNLIYTAPKPINLMYNHPNVMLCHANFVQHSIVGDSYFPILKIIPTETLSSDNYISLHFDHLEFIKTNVKYLKDLHFQLKQLNGDFIEFADNSKVILNIAIKKM